MKKLLALMLALVMALSLAACSSAPAGDASKTPDGDSQNTAAPAGGDNVIKIGVFEPLSGDSASGGKKEYLGMQYANSETPTVEVNGTTYTI